MNSLSISSFSSGTSLLRVSKLNAKTRKFLRDKGFQKCDPMHINNRHGNNYQRWCAKRPDMKDFVSFLKENGANGMSWWITTHQEEGNLPATDKQWQARIIF